MAVRPDRAAATPLWQQVHDDLLRRVDDGEFAEGLPGEPDLARQYQVSRYTVRQALQDLRERGLIVSRPGRVSTVGSALTSEVTTDETVTDPDIARRLGLPESALLRVQERVWRRGTVAVAIETLVQPAASANPVVSVPKDEA